MNLVKIANETFVDPSDVVSIEREVVKAYYSSSPSDGSTYEKFNGTRITLKNGRKVFVDGVGPDEIHKILDEHKPKNNLGIDMDLIKKMQSNK